MHNPAIHSNTPTALISFVARHLWEMFSLPYNPNVLLSNKMHIELKMQYVGAHSIAFKEFATMHCLLNASLPIYWGNDFVSILQIVPCKQYPEAQSIAPLEVIWSACKQFWDKDSLPIW